MVRVRTAPAKQTWRKYLPAAALAAGLGLLLLAILAVGKLTRAQISGWDSYTFAFAEIDCPAPPVQKRAEFLAEVQGLSKLPDRLALLDEGLPARLAEAFAQHPYVERVEQVSILPTHRIEVRLAYRIPVLEVMLSERDRELRSAPPESTVGKGDIADDPSWFIDAKGVLLPRKKLSDPLPLLLVTAPPAALAGQPWGIASIEAAARTAGLLGPHQSRLHLKVFERRGQEWVLSTGGGARVLWGHAPGNESTDEAKAATKLERLLKYCTEQGSLEKPSKRVEHDVRPVDTATHVLLDG